MRKWFRLQSRRSWESKLDAELRFHFEEHVRELVASGMSPSAARREARQELGGVEQVKESIRDGRPTRWLEDWWRDTGFALRGLRQDRSFSVIAILTLGLGIGAATVIFSVGYPVLFEPLSYPDADQLVLITELDAGASSIAFGTYREVSIRSRSLQGVAVFRSWLPSLTGEGEPERLEAQRVSAGYFDVLGVGLAMGAGFREADDRPGGPDVVILSESLWRRRFGADPGILGQQVRLDGRPYVVVGVMPAGFSNVASTASEAWTLLQYDTMLPGHDSREWGRHLGMVARLAEGVEMASARGELREIGATPISEFARPSWASMEEGLVVRSLKVAVTAAARPLLLALFGAVAVLLTIACANVTNLVLGRNARRRAEVALRTALGASRGRVARQFLTESLTLAGLGGVLGVVIAYIGVSGLNLLAISRLPYLEEFRVDGLALGFAFGVASLVGVLVGAFPALNLEGAELRGRIQDASGRATRRQARTRHALVVAEIALALVLLVGAALLMGSLQRLLAIAPGFDPEGRSVMQIQVSGEEFGDEAAVRRFFEAALAAARAVPGIESAALTSQLPLSGDLDMYGVTLEESTEGGQDGAAYRYAVSPGYFEAMGIGLVKGRVLGAEDLGEARPVAVISESLAANAFPGRDAIGERAHFGSPDLPSYEIVGVVRDVKQTSLDAGPAHAFYITFDQWYFADSALWLVSKARGTAAVPASDIKSAIWTINDDQPIVRAQPLDELVARSEAQRSFALLIFGVFATIAWVLAGVGLYGVVSGGVNERIQELGVRSALGATPRDILLLVVRQGMAIATIGIAVGLGGAALASSALVTLLFEVSRLDAATYVGTALALAILAAVACWLPARRAARVDPAETLRAQ